MAVEPEVKGVPGLYSYGWLPAVVPAAAHRFLVADGALAAGLALSGAEIVEHDEDVEIAPAGEVRGDAPLLIATVAAPPVFGPLPVRAAGRLVNSLRVWLGAARAGRATRRDYPVVEVLRLDTGHAFALPGAAGEVPARRLAERLPQQALVVGRRGERSPTMLEAALADAAERSGRDLRPRWASIRAGLVVVFAQDTVLRVAFGRAREQLAAQFAALDAIRAAQPPAAVAERLPWPLAHGRIGLADWSLERLLPGARPPRTLSPTLLEDSLEFLVELWRVPDGARADRSFAELADTTATVCRPESAAAVHALAERLGRELGGLPRGFAHGDFFAGNMLAAGGRLTGVLDWDAGGSGRLPFLDLLHLHRTLVHDGSDLWGGTLLAQLLPFARAGGDETVRRYGREIGIEADGRLLEALALAYWLDHTAYQLRTHHHRRSEPDWIEVNVEQVVRAFASR